MVEIRLSLETPVPPARVLAAATDFSERRPEIWRAIDGEAYRVHEVGPDHADVTEGGREFGGMWAREHYVWTPDLVTAEVQESNVFRAGSTWQLGARPSSNGGSVVSLTVRRHPRGLKGRLVVFMMRLGGRRYLSGYLRETLERLEAAVSD